MRRVISVILVLVMAVALFAGCGGGQATTTGTTEKPGDTDATTSDSGVAGAIEDGAKLVYWPMWAETEPQGVVIADAIEAFTDETGVEVEINWAGGRDTRKILQPALDTGETIDVFDEDVERINITWGKYLLDIQKMYDASALNGSQNATLINLVKELGDGSLKSVPYQPFAFLMMYNKDAFDKAGISAVPTSWDEFMDACQKLVDAGYIPLTIDDAYMASFFGYMVDRVAGADVAEAIAAGDFSHEAVLKTAEVIEEMISKGYIDPRAAANVWPAGQGNIADGSVAMYLNGTWLPNEIKNQTPGGFRWGSFSLPQITEAGDGVEAIIFGSQCFAINKETKYPNAAFALIEWLTSGEWDQQLANQTMGVPMANNATWPEPLAEAKTAIDNTTKRLPSAVGMENEANVNASIKENLSKMINGSMDAQEFADAFSKTQLG